jgi:hypothetical protein
LQTQHDLSVKAYRNRKEILQILDEISAAKRIIKNQSLIDSLDKLVNGTRERQDAGFGQLNGTFAALHNLLQDSDMPPTAQMISGMSAAEASFQKLLAKWYETKKKISG